MKTCNLLRFFKHSTGILSVLILTSCGGPNEDLALAIEQELKSNSWKEVDVAKAVPFDWDRMCILPPYLLENNQKQILGFEAPTMVSNNDSLVTLVFIKNETVKSYTHMDRYMLDAIAQCYEQNNSLIRFKRLDSQ